MIKKKVQKTVDHMKSCQAAMGQHFTFNVIKLLFLVPIHLQSVDKRKGVKPTILKRVVGSIGLQ